MPHLDNKIQGTNLNAFNVKHHSAERQQIHPEFMVNKANIELDNLQHSNKKRLQKQLQEQYFDQMKQSR